MFVSITRRRRRPSRRPDPHPPPPPSISRVADFRYMATSDLLAELSKESFRATADVEKKVCGVVLRQLDDASGDVSSLAVKCLPPLVKGASPAAAADVVDGLCAKLATIGKDAAAQRDVAVIGLKTIVAELGYHASASRIVSSLAPKLIERVVAVPSSSGANDAKPSNAANDVSGECLDILHAVVCSYGTIMTSRHADLVDALLRAMDDASTAKRRAGRKRAAACLAALAGSVDDALLGTIADAATSRLDALGPDAIARCASASACDDARLCAHLLGASAKSAGARFGATLRRVDATRRVVELARAASEEHAEALREQCLTTLEMFASRCPAETAEDLPAVVELALTMASYDPNYADDDDDDDGGAMDVDGGDDAMDDGDDSDDDDGSDDGSDDESDDDQYSDDEDASWKVRRAAVKLLSAAVAGPSPSSAAVLESHFERVKRTLLSRLPREREETVKMDVYACLEDVVGACGPRRAASASLAATATEVRSYTGSHTTPSAW